MRRPLLGLESGDLYFDLWRTGLHGQVEEAGAGFLRCGLDRYVNIPPVRVPSTHWAQREASCESAPSRAGPQKLRVFHFSGRGRGGAREGWGKRVVGIACKLRAPSL